MVGKTIDIRIDAEAILRRTGRRRARGKANLDDGASGARQRAPEHASGRLITSRGGRKATADVPVRDSSS